jgi:hypothetical protein
MPTGASGFMETGIWPFSPDSFTGCDDSTSAFVTERPGPNVSQKDSQDIRKSSNKLPFFGSNNMDSNNGTEGHYKGRY